MNHFKTRAWKGLLSLGVSAPMFLLMPGCATPGETTGPSAQAFAAAATTIPTRATDAANAGHVETDAASAADGVAAVAVDPWRPDVRLDLSDRTAQTDLWVRVRRGFAMPDLDNDLVRNREQWYATRP